MPSRRPKGSGKRRRGFALLMVLILIVLLTVLVMGFQRDVMRETKITENVSYDLKAEYLANMALVRGQAILRLDEHAEYDSLNEAWAQPLSWEGETFSSPELDSGGEEESTPQPQVLITDEERKFNLLTLVRGNELQQKRAEEVLTRLIQICRREDDRLILDGESRNVRRADDDSVTTKALVENLVRYLNERASEDSDDLEFTANSGDEPDVRSMKKQTPFEMLTVGELLQVEGWTRELIFGKVRRAGDEDSVYSADERRDEDDEDEGARDWKDLSDEEKFEHNRSLVEQQDQLSSDPSPLPIINYVTLYSSGFINVNTASRELILALHEDLTWDVVEQIITARDQARRDVAEEEETGEIPIDEEPVDPEAPEEEEDQASFRPQDLANFQAFVQRVNYEETEEGAEPAGIEGFTEEIYNAMRPWLVVRSSVFTVEASATIGKVTHSIRAVYRRSGSNQGEAAPPAEGEQPAQPDEPSTPADGELPSEPDIKLTLLLRDTLSGG